MEQFSLTVHSSPSLDAIQFVQQVLATRPTLAVFDCDGTLWSGDAGADFFYWEIAQGIHRAGDCSRDHGQRYNEYLAGRVDELAICGEMIQINKGVPGCMLARARPRVFSRDRGAPDLSGV